MSVRNIAMLAGACSMAATGGLLAQEATTRIDVEGNRFVISIGPLDLPVAAHAHGVAMEMDAAMPMGEGASHRDGMVMPPVSEVRIPFDAYVYGFGYDIVDADGNELSQSLLHHLNVIDPHRRDLFLPISYRLAAVGSETEPMRLPRFLFGHPVAAGQELVISAMLHNPTHTAFEDVTVRFYFDYMRTGRPWPLFRVHTFQMDVSFPAGDKDFDLPPGRSSRSWEGSPSIDGRIVAVGGHVHPNAVNLVLEDVTSGRQIWEGTPILDDAGELVGVTIGRLYRRFGVRIHRDRVYRVTVTYDNETADTIPEGGMGVIGGLFIPATDEWPVADVSNALYQLDRQHYLREVHGQMDELTVPDSASAGHNHGTR